MQELSKGEYKILKGLNSAKKIQDFVNSLKVNFEYNGETCMSPRRVLREGRAHCIEAAFLAWLAFKINGKKAWIVDLKGTKDDWDHVICVFKKDGQWGCVSKSNHAAHRYREPIYRDIRELVMSIFHEYIDKRGRKNLRSFSVPIDMKKFGKKWITSEKELWNIHDALDKVKHFNILTRKQIANLRRADKVEIRAGNIVGEKKK